MRPSASSLLFRRQFLLTDEPTGLAPERFTYCKVAEGHLYHCPELPVAHLVDAEGVPWVLLGEGLPLKDDRGPAEMLLSCRTEAVPDAYRQWDGRWMLIGDGHVHTDLRGSIPAFYTYGALASTPGILRPGALPRPGLSKSERCDWFPAPGSAFTGVSRLLPSQVLRLADRGCFPRELPRSTGLAHDDALTGMRESLRKTLSTVRHQRLVLPLTAGWDSRLLLAACVDADLEALCVTLTYPQMSKADRELPPLLAKAADFEYRRVEPVPRKERVGGAGELYDAQVGGHMQEMDRLFLQRRQYDWVRPGDTLLRGLGLDVLRGNHHLWPPAGVEDIDRIVHWYQPSSVQEQGLRRYMAWLEKDPQDVPFAQRFSAEQGDSAWGSMSDVALDLTGGHSLNPGNAWAFSEAVLSLPAEYRFRSSHHREVIGQIASRLLSVPVNPPESRWRPRRVAGALQRRAVRWSGKARRP